MENFKKLGLDLMILKSLEQLKFSEPTDVQEKTIPLSLDGKDIIACSATGSGKTLAFSACIIQNSFRKKGVQALILTPTRELAQQVASEIKKFSKHKFLETACIYGGVAINPQMDKLKKADVVIGTPGRILDHFERRTIDFSNVKFLVLDEADRMLDMGFIDDIEKIIKTLPKERQTLLFSATIDSDISKIARKHMINPEKIDLNNRVDPTKLKQVYYDTPNSLKFSLLAHFVKEQVEKNHISMIFCNTQRNTDFIAKNLKKNGVNALAIHGGFTQAKRNKTMQDFHSGNFDTLVCTDVAARGLDIKNVSCIFNYDIPNDSKQYVHRIGRTARAGAEGIAINILSDRDHDNFRRVLSEGSLNIEKLKAPYVEKAEIVLESNRRDSRQGGRNGGSRDGRSSRMNSDRSGFGDRRPSSGNRPRSDSGDRRPSSGSRPRSDSGDRRPSSGSRPRSDSGDRRPSSGSRPRSDSGDRRPSFGSKPRSDSGDRRPSSGSRPRSDSGDRRPSSGSRPRSDSGDRRPSSGNRPRSDSGDKRSSNNYRSNDRPKRSFSKKQ